MSFLEWLRQHAPQSQEPDVAMGFSLAAFEGDDEAEWGMCWLAFVNGVVVEVGRVGWGG